jgi:hypothetical protein
MPFPFLLAAAAIGAGIGALSTYTGNKAKEKELIRQSGMAERAYGYKSGYERRMFSLQQGKALEDLGMARNRLADAFGANMAGFNLGLEGQALQNHDARIALADNAGMALAAQGASGTRGSDSLSMRLDYAQDSFNRQTDLRDRGNSLVFQDMIRQYSNRFDDIGREIDSWGPGGYRYKAYELGRDYAENMQGLQREGYEGALDDLSFKNSWTDYLTGALSGAASGAGLGADVKKWWEQK